MKYTVRWDVYVEADSPEAAAKSAKVMLREESVAGGWAFEVYELDEENRLTSCGVFNTAKMNADNVRE